MLFLICDGETEEKLGEKVNGYGEETAVDNDAAGDGEAGAMLGVDLPAHSQRFELQFLHPPNAQSAHTPS